MDKTLSSWSSVFTKTRIKYLWIYVTDRCNLKCSYCFYKFRNGRSAIDINNIKLLFRRIPNLRHSEFVISGGEPLLEWSLTQRLIAYLKSNFNNHIMLQTNATLLDSKKIKSLKNNNVSLELGLDGVLSTMSRQRINIDSYWGRIIKNINAAKDKGMRLYATMTVHPRQARKIWKNYAYLINLGIEKVEITPAAFEEWHSSEVSYFKKGYREVVRYSLANKRLNSISVEYDKPLHNMTIDLIPLPDNNVMTNWALLSLPRSLKAEYAILKINRGKICLNNNFLSLYQKYRSLFNDDNITYRDYSNLNAGLAYKALFRHNFKAFFDNYIELGLFLKNINQKVLSIGHRKALNTK